MMPNMTREGRKQRLEAWQAGQDLAARLNNDLTDVRRMPRELQIEYLRGIGQWFSAKAHELTKEAE